MKRFQKLLALTTLMTLLVSSAYSQEPNYYDDGSYGESRASDLAAYAPIALLVGGGAILIATTSNRHHNHSSSSSHHAHGHFGFGSGSSSSSSSSF